MFYQDLEEFGENAALYQDGEALSYRELEHAVKRHSSDLLGGELRLLLLKCHNDVDTVVSYLSALRSEIPLMLVDKQISDDALDELVNAYGPSGILDGGEFQPIQPRSGGHAIDPRLALLLSTSGSTGSPKQVCLSRKNLKSNTESICAFLPIESGDVTITTLPFHYCFGLSILNTHLQSGACVSLTKAPMTSREFWDLFERQRVNSFAGVPATYDLLLQLRWFQKPVTHLKYFTQAGGKLGPAKVKRIAEYARRMEAEFFVMYGQTEATARMSYLSPDKALQKPDSIGRAIPGGTLEIRDSAGEEVHSPNTEGELYYRGDNVMLGYSEKSEDLILFQPLPELPTGDLAIKDEDGDYKITGRRKRIVKPQGKRISLDDLESWVEQRGLPCRTMGDGDRILVALRKTDQNREEKSDVKKDLANFLQLHSSLIRIEWVEEFPLTASGKTDYPRLARGLIEKKS